MFKKLWKKYRELFWELFRFGLVGGISFLFDYGTLMLFLQVFFSGGDRDIQLLGFTFDLFLFIATAVGFIVGVTVNYILSILFVFKAAKDGKGRSKKAMLVFLIGAVIGFFLTVALVQVGAAFFGNGAMAVTCVKVAATIVVMFWNYITRKIFIFRV
ncbi:MAG: GtrA family protein [Oscillospiraceae bacterium]|jgi:putative flippase GtrA|nr:GtrA family protein [Oscillospiraceae bacterium]